MITEIQAPSKISKRTLSWKRFLLHAQVPAIVVSVFVIIAAAGVPYLREDVNAIALVNKLQALKSKQESIIDENDELRRRIANESRISRIAERASDMGFVEAEETNILVVNYEQEGNAEKNTQPEAPVEPGSLSENASGPWASLRTMLDEAFAQFHTWLQASRVEAKTGF